MCAINGLTADSKCDNELRTAYGRKFEKLKFRPLYIQMFVEAWINNDFYQHALNVYDHSTGDIEILSGRLEVLKRWIIKDEDDPAVLYGLVCNEYEFWKSVVVPDDDSDQTDMVATLKVCGLNYVAKQFGDGQIKQKLQNKNSKTKALEQIGTVGGTRCCSLVRRMWISTG